MTDLPPPACSSPRSLHDLSFAEMSQELTAAGVSAHHTKALWRALYRDDNLNPASPVDLLPPLQRWLAASVGAGRRFFLDAPEVADEIPSGDGLTRKFLLRLNDGATIETVLMRYDGRHTACVSTQVGCAMACVFCANGQMGSIRHLRPGEIIAQVLHVRRVLRAAEPTRQLRNHSTNASKSVVNSPNRRTAGCPAGTRSGGTAT